MRNLFRNIRQTFTVARRDFLATVLTPAFLLFLLTPVFMIGFAAMGSMGAQSLADGGQSPQRIVVIAPADRTPAIIEIDKQLRRMLPAKGEDSSPVLKTELSRRNPAAQASALFHGNGAIAAVMYGPLERPTILRDRWAEPAEQYLKQLAEQTLRAERAGGPARLSAPEIEIGERQQPATTGQSAMAYIATLAVFLLTVLLSGQAVGTMAEEKSNKVIEVLAAAVPLESVFLGKLIGMFGSAILFIAFWSILLFNLPHLLSADAAGQLSQIQTAIPSPVFPLLVAAYFAASYMLFSALFLTVGALASTQREIQMLVLPITVAMMAMGGWSLASLSQPHSMLAIAAQVFPFSSPMAMAGRGAHSPELWPHFVALGWQFLWVGIVVTIGARVFRRGVLKSGGPRSRLFGKD